MLRVGRNRLILERFAVRPLLTARLIIVSADLNAIDSSFIYLRFVKGSDKFKTLITEVRVYTVWCRCKMLKQRLGKGGTIRFRKTGTDLAMFMYGTNSGLPRLELK